MGIAAKHLDPIVGLDMHMVQPPPPAPPIMMPIPVAGYLIDPNDYGSCKVRLNGFPPARAGTPGVICPPHIPPGGMFVKPPTNECEMFQGSSTVVFAGDAAASQGNPVLTCHDVGMPAPVRSWRKSPTKSLMMAAANVIPIPGPCVVMIGGAPTITMTASSSETQREDEKALETIELEVFDAFGERFRRGRYELHLPNGDVEEGALDGDGVAKVSDVPSGYSLLVLPDFEASQRAASKPTVESLGKPSNPKEGPVGTAGGADASHIVSQGDTVRRIANRFGIADWRSVYDHASNKSLRDARPNPNILLAGDVVNIVIPQEPAITYRLGGIAIRSGCRSMVLESQLEHVHVRLDSKTTAVEKVTVFDGCESREASMGTDGCVSGAVALGTRRVELLVLDKDGVEHRVVLRFGDLDPATNESGLKHRLASLGFFSPGDELAASQKRFKSSIGRDPDEPFDDDDIQALVEAHRS